MHFKSLLGAAARRPFWASNHYDPFNKFNYAQYHYGMISFIQEMGAEQLLCPRNDLSMLGSDDFWLW